MLQLNTRLEKVGSTQTDPFGDDSDCTQRHSTSMQTESEWDRAKVNDLLKAHDEQLTELIAEIENAKLQAQSDYKFAVIQMEQGLREEHEEEVGGRSRARNPCPFSCAPSRRRRSASWRRWCASRASSCTRSRRTRPRPRPS